jgi:hypothetical protein
MAGEGLRGGIKGGNQGGEVKTLTDILMLETVWRGVAGGGEETRWCSQDRPTWRRG